MAEQTQEKRTFKWGDREYLLDDLLAEHAKRELEYYNFARLKGQYDDTALQGLRSAISNRIAAVKSGQSFDGDGVLAGDRVDNTSIQTLKKGLFKKEKYVDQDNTEWAKYYLNKLVGQLNPYTREPDKESSWDLTKHGLGAYLTGLGLNAKDIFEKYDLRDKDNPENPRSFDLRRALLKLHLSGYKDWLAKKGFDFTKNDNEWDDNFGADFDKFILDYDSLDINSLTSNLRKFGAGDGYTTAFTSDRWDLNKTNEEIEEEAKRLAEEKRKKEEKEKWNLHATDSYNAFMRLEDNNLGGLTYFTTEGDGMFALSDSEYEKWLNTHTNDKDAYMKNLQDSYYKNPFDIKIVAEYLPLADRFGALKEVNIDGKTYKYDPRTIDRNKNRFVAVDPESGEIRHAFLWDIEDEGKALQRKWRIDNGYEDASAKYQMKKDGGLLYMQTGGGFNLAQSVNRDLEERNKARAEATGNTEEVQKARDRVVSNGKQRLRSEKDSIALPDAGFTVADGVRLAAIGADIVSMFLDPLSGTITGLASSVANLGADFDDGVQWRDFGNFATSVGLDLLGAIPVVGDAAGTGSKITKNLLKYAPKVMAGLSVYQGAKNVDGMVESWGKLTSSDSSDKMTVLDWRNIALSIQLLTGGVRAAKNVKSKNKMMEAAKVPDATTVNVRHKQTGEVTKYIVDGETAKALRGSKTAKDAEVSLSKLERFKNHFGDNGEFEVVTQGKGPMLFPLGKTADGWGWRGTRKPGAPDVGDYYDFSRATNGYGQGIDFTGKPKKLQLYERHRKYIEDLNKVNSSDHKGAKTIEEVDAEIKALRDPIDAELEKMKVQMLKKVEGVDGHRGLKDVESDIKTTKEEIKALLKKLRGIKESDVQAELHGLRRPGRGLKTLETKIKQTQTKIDSLGSQIKAIDQQITTGKALKRDVSQLEARKTLLESQVQTSLNALDNLQLLIDNIKGNQTKHSELESTISDFDLLRRKQKNLNKLNQELLDSRHTSSYKRLQKMILDYQTNHSSIEGRNVNWDLKQILKDAGITNAFKLGGSVDRNKINKFLNYAKG